MRHRALASFFVLGLLLLVCCGGQRSQTVEPEAPNNSAQDQQSTDDNGDDQFVAFWLVKGPADHLGNQPAWWVNEDGQVFDFIVNRRSRPQPDPDARPLALIRPDGSVWGPDGTSRRAHISDDGEVITHFGDADMRCRISDDCELQCDCDGHGPEIRFRYRPRRISSQHIRIEPAPSSPAQCRRSLTLLGLILIETDSASHQDIF